MLIAILPNAVKKCIDLTTLPAEYASVVDLPIKDGKILLDLTRKDLSVYKGLDKYLYANPTQFSPEERKRFDQLCEICPQMNIKDNLIISSSTVEEYREGEQWINDVLQGIDSNWSTLQKVAYIDNKIGKRISYAPEYGTEAFDVDDSRSLWKILSCGYGVCNGIAQVEEYILKRASIDCNVISGRNHAFLKLNNIEIQLEDGTQVSGNTILDPTWNLTAHRFNCRPNCFCLSYDEMRKHDIDLNDQDTKIHQNDKELADATLNVPDSVLRDTFRSLNLADKYGNFFAKELVEKSNKIDSSSLSSEKNVELQFELLKRYCPDFATCINSTSSILQNILLNHPNLEFNKCVVKKVYDREDTEKHAVLYVYMDFPEDGNTFFYADKVSGQFIELPQEEFEKKFECYDTELEASNGLRQWEISERENQQENLLTSSGEVTVEEER